MKKNIKLISITIVMILLTVQMHAICNKSDLIKLRDKGFTKIEIDRICDLQIQGTKVKKINDMWIKPTDNSCRSKGGKIYEGICKSTKEQAKDICHATGGYLPSINELKKVVVDCDGTVNKYKENGVNQNYQTCYKKEGFFDSSSYWSSSVYDDKHVWVLDFKFGASSKGENKEGYVRCIKSKQ